MKKLSILVALIAIGLSVSVASTNPNRHKKKYYKKHSVTRSDTVGIGDSKIVDGDYIGGLHISESDALGYTIYNHVVPNYTVKVTTKDELLNALKSAQNGTIIYVDDKSIIDLTNVKDIHIPAGVTLASGRGKLKSKGALLFTTLNGTLPLLDPGNHVRITGLRIQGPDTSIGKSAYVTPVSRGISIAGGSDVTIDDCELSGWSHAAIFLTNGAHNIYVHHNYFHHNHRTGLGYGVCLDKASALVKANVFDYARHAVAGTGNIGTSYEACYNLILPNFIGHAFDMHGGFDRKDNTNIAGDTIKIYNNTIFVKDFPGVWIRGVPQYGAFVKDNDFINLNNAKAIKQTDKVYQEFLNKNMHMYGNRFSKN